jgi:hydrogenase nickel incorporation protein HypA/HybF
MTEHGCQRVSEVRLSIGEFSGVEPALLRSAFDELVSGTPLQSAVLQLAEVSLEARCEVCGHQFAVERFAFECPECASRRVTIVRGEDLMIESLVMEEFCRGQA